MTTRRDIAFEAEGVTLRGWLYLPEAPRGEAPQAEGGEVPFPIAPFATIVMAHGFSGVKEQYLDDYAAAFAAAGLAALVYDHRNFGASDGEPRQKIDPVLQARDYRHAITFARSLPEVDGERIGIWGTSFSGGHVLMVAAVDRRVKCVVSQVPTISGPEAALRRVRPDLMPAVLAAFDADREARFHGEAPKSLPVIAEEATAPCALPGRECWDFFDASLARAPAYRNEVTLRSLEMAREYEPGTWVHRISPTPLLLIVAEHDSLTPTDLALEAFERARHPKKLVLLKGGHFGPYVAQFEESSRAAVAWFTEHLAAA